MSEGIIYLSFFKFSENTNPINVEAVNFNNSTKPLVSELVVQDPMLTHKVSKITIIK